MKKEELQRILFESNKELTFISDKEIEEFRIFFHKEKQKQALVNAQKHLSDRQMTAREIEAQAKQLASCLFELSKLFSTPYKDTEDLIKSCAELTVFSAKRKEEISTNILFFLNKTIMECGKNRIFLQIQKELLFIEAAEKALGALPADWEVTKAFLSSLPPQELATQASHILKVYEETEHFLSTTLTNAAKAAKRKDAAQYQNLLHNAAIFLFDTATCLESAKKGE